MAWLEVQCPRVRGQGTGSWFRTDFTSSQRANYRSMHCNLLHCNPFLSRGESNPHDQQQQQYNHHLYALCWLLELHPANSTRACEWAAAKGPLPQFEARYRSFTKSAFDGRWRLVDVCNRDKRVALFAPDDEQSYTSRWIKCLLYCRLHGPLQPKSEAQRPHKCHL